MNKISKNTISAITLLALSFQIMVPVVAIEEKKEIQKNKKAKFSWIKKEKNNKNIKSDSKKTKKIKNTRVEEIKLPKVFQGKPDIPFNKLSVMSIDDCVNYALTHNPNLSVSKERIKAAKSGIGQARANYAPRLMSRLGYGYSDTHNRMSHTTNNSMSFNVGVSQMIWDFGRTTAKINMAKYDTESAQYDYDYDVLRVVYDVKINYYKVLAALAHLDIYEQNVRIQTLNYERTKAMFDEGLKSKIDVVNAQVNLSDAKIQLVDGRNKLETAIIELENSMFFQEDVPFIVKNTENFGFLKADYRKKVESLSSIKPVNSVAKKNEDGLIMLSSGIEHNDIIQNFEFKPLALSKQEAVNLALEMRPDLKSNQMVAKVQKESLKAIKKQYMPEISGDLTWGYSRSESQNYSSPLQVGATMSFGSVNPYGIHYQIKEGESMLDIALHNVNIAKTDIFWEVQSNYVNMRQLERKIPLMNTKVKATLENFELADGRYSVGLNNYVELQDALTNYNNEQLNFVEAVFNYNVARETLLKSMGVK